MPAANFADFNELADLVVDYGHRPELRDRAAAVFIPFASIRIGRDLKSRANERAQDLDGAQLGNPMPLPEDFGSIRSVWYNGNRGPHTLRSRDENTINSYPIQGANPRAYMIRNAALHVRPFVAGSYTINYHFIPTLDANNLTNAVLVQFPMVYLYAALVELHVFTMDTEQRSIALATYGDEVKIINRNEGRARASALAAVGGT